MANFLKLFYLSSFNLKNQNIPRLKFIISFAIFLSIFAVTASIITIFYELKIDKIEKKLLDKQREIQFTEISLDTIVYQITTSTFNFDPLKSQYLKDRYYYWTDSSILNDRDIFYRNFINFYTTIEQDFYFIDLLVDLVIDFDIDPKKIKGVKILLKKKKFQKILDEIKQDEANYTTDDNIFDPQIDDYFYKYKDYLEFLFEIHNEAQFFLIDGYNKIKKKEIIERKNIINISKKISNLSNISVKIIFIAFLIQLIIFIIIQFFEISSNLRQEDNEKR